MISAIDKAFENTSAEVRAESERAFQLGKREQPYIRIREVTASRGKSQRTEPISLLYEKNRVLHRRGLDQLEGEMLSFSRQSRARRTSS